MGRPPPKGARNIPAMVFLPPIHETEEFGGGDAWEIRGISGGCCWIHPHLTYSSPITHQRCSELLTFCFTAITGILGQGPSNPAEIPIGFYLFKHKTPPFSRRGEKTFSPDFCACISEDHVTSSSLALTKSYLIASALKKESCLGYE